MPRTQVYKTFNKYKQEEDTRSMDEICKNDPMEFSLQVQQKFLKDYITAHPSWKKLLLYHQIGSGKTCTSITLAEQYMQLNPGAKVTVVLPARLKTNFIDELISPCGMDKYISKKDFETYHKASTSDFIKKLIKTKYMKAIKKKYEVMSFEKFKKLAISHGDLKTWAEKFSKDRLIIVDEVHNLLSDVYDSKKSDEIFESGIYKMAKGSNTIIFKYLASHMHESGKMILLTATPIFNTLGQIRELVHVMSPELAGTMKKNSKISDILKLLKDKVSFFPGTSAQAYPAVNYEFHEIPLSKTQDDETNIVLLAANDVNDPNHESFKAKQRQISLACLPNSLDISKNIPTILNNLSEYAPKIKEAVELLKLPGKHLIYSNFVKSGLNIVKELLLKLGWVDLMSQPSKNKRTHDYKVFAVWDGKTKDADKTKIKNIANSVDNMDGKYLRVIIGSPSMKEGVSFKHIQHMHLLDPVWNSSAKDQVEGRAIRFCSHSDIPNTHKVLKRTVNVHIYKSMPKLKKPQVAITCDQDIYNTIIPRKEVMVKAGEKALQKIAIDYFLFRNMYSKKKKGSPPRIKSNQSSVVSIDSDKNLHIGTRKNKTRKHNSCPKKRRPNVNGECGKNEEIRTNLHGNECCYKIKQIGVKSTCPKPRRPDAKGKCVKDHVKKENRHGDECCYKIRQKKQA